MPEKCKKIIKREREREAGILSRHEKWSLLFIKLLAILACIQKKLHKDLKYKLKLVEWA